MLTLKELIELKDQNKLKERLLKTQQARCILEWYTKKEKNRGTQKIGKKEEMKL